MEALAQFDAARASYVYNDKPNVLYLLEDNVVTEQLGVVVGFAATQGVGYAAGLTRAEFLNVYPDYATLLPTEPIVISYLEYATIEDFASNVLEKAYYIFVDDDKLADPTYEGLNGYPISHQPLSTPPQIAVTATEANIKRLPEAVQNVLPDDVSDLEYIRFDRDMSRISYEREIEIGESVPPIEGIDSSYLQNRIDAVRAHSPIERIMVKVSVTGEPAKIYYRIENRE